MPIDGAEPTMNKAVGLGAVSEIRARAVLATFGVSLRTLLNESRDSIPYMLVSEPGELGIIPQ